MGFAVVSAGVSGVLRIVFGEILFSSSRIRYLFILAQHFYYECTCRFIDKLAVFVWTFE